MLSLLASMKRTYAWQHSLFFIGLNKCVDPERVAKIENLRY